MNYTDDLYKVQVGDVVLEKSMSGTDVLNVIRTTPDYIYTTGDIIWRKKDGKRRGNKGGRAEMGSATIFPFESPYEYEKWLSTLRKREMRDFYHSARFLSHRTVYGDVLPCDFTGEELTQLYSIMQSVKFRKGKG
jgi:hypothetical protein